MQVFVVLASIFFFRVFTIAYMNKFSFMMSGRACICGSAELCSFIPVYKDFFLKKKIE